MPQPVRVKHPGERNFQKLLISHIVLRIMEHLTVRSQDDDWRPNLA